jgi:hypothetical protein
MDRAVGEDLVGWSVGRLVCWSVGRLVGWSVGLLVCWWAEEVLRQGYFASIWGTNYRLPCMGVWKGLTCLEIRQFFNPEH